MEKKQIILTIMLITALVIVGTFSFLLGKETTITTLAITDLEQNNQQTSNPEFRTFTQAFCEEKDFYKECTDQLVIQCGNTRHKVDIVNGKANIELQ